MDAPVQVLPVEEQVADLLATPATDRQRLMAILSTSILLLQCARDRTLSTNEMIGSALLIGRLAYRLLGQPELTLDPDWPGNHTSQDAPP